MFLASIYKWMNEFLEQLVRDLTNAYSRSQKCLVSVYHLAPQISEAIHVFLVAGGQMLVKQQPLIHLYCLCSVSLPISVFFTHSLLVVLRKGQTTVSKRRGLIACVPNNDTNGKLLSPNHLWSLPAAPHSDLSARQYKGVIPGYDVRPSALQHVIRGCFRSLLCNRFPTAQRRQTLWLVWS